MVIALIIILTFSLILLSFIFKTKIIWCFLLHILGIGLIVYSIMLYNIKLGMSSYRIPWHFDYLIYTTLSHNKIHISTMSLIYNFGLGVIMMSSVYITVITCNMRKWKAALLFLLIILCIWSNSPQVLDELYIRMNTSTPTISQHYILLNNFVKYSFSILFIVYLIIPIIVFFHQMFKAKILLTKKHILACTCCLTLIDVYTIYFYIWGPFKNFLPHNKTSFSFPSYLISWNYFALIPMLLLLVLLIVLSLVYYYKPFGNLSFFKESAIISNTTMLDQNLKMIFHTYKNMLLTVNLLSEQAEQYIDITPAKAKENLQKVMSLSQEYINSSSNVIEMLKNVDIIQKNINVVQCLEAAIERVMIPNDIIIERLYESHDIFVYGEIFQLKEAIANLIHNSVEALKQKNATNEKRISLSIEYDSDWVQIKITDNGIGIKHKNIKYIFTSLYSTKSSAKNYGLGLTYTQKVIKAHLGHIFVKSKVGEYTCFQVLLPININRK